MRLPRRLPALLLLGGAAALAAAVVLGQARFALFLIFPVVYGEGPLALLGGLLLMAGFILYFLRLMSSATRPQSAAGAAAIRTRKGGILLLGPFPLIYGSDPIVARWMLAAALVLMAVVAVLLLAATIL